MKICTVCQIEKPITEFNKNACKKDGLQTLCRTCSKANSKFYYDANPKRHRKNVSRRLHKIIEWMNNEKSKLSCKECGASHVSFLQFHHLNPKQKEVSVGDAVAQGWSIKRIENEISKCIVLCANCHFKLHWEEKQSKP